MFNLEDIFEKWIIATEEDVSGDKIKIGLEHSWLVHEAKKCLQTDPSGLMSAIKMREAYKAFIRDHYYTIGELLEGAWDEKFQAFMDLKWALFAGEVQKLYDNFMTLVVKTAKLLGKEATKEEFSNIEKSESIIFDSLKNFNDNYKLHHEKFNERIPKQCDNARVLPILYRFDYLKQFVDSLKNTPEDNFICLSLIERTYERCDSDYDKRFDTFFAFGVKNNGAVYIVSDRTIFHSPETYFKTRNPGREYSNKVDYSWFPYYKMDAIKGTVNKDNVLLITDGSEQVEHTNYIVDAFDNEGIMFISLLFTLIYKKYFLDLDNLTETKNWFSSEIKYLPSTTSTALVPSETQLQVIETSLNITADTWEFDDKIYTNSLWDFYIQEYPLPEENCNKLVDYIGSEDDFKRLSWWRMRKMQYEHILKCLNDNCGNRQAKCEEWLKDQMITNSTHILNYLLSNKPVCLYDKFTVNASSSHKDEDKQVLWEAIRDYKDIDTVEISHTKFKHNMCEYTGDKECFYRQNIIRRNTNEGEVFMYIGHRYPRIDCWFTKDSNCRPIELQIKLRSYADFMRLFGITKDALPKELKRHFNDRIDMFSLYGWMPYTGNSILNFVDPMNDLRDPYKRIDCTMVLYVSKSKYKKLCKQIGIDSNFPKEDDLDD